MNKKTVVISASVLFAVIASFAIGFFISENDVLDDLSDIFSSKEVKTTVTPIDKKETKSKSKKFQLFGPKVNITKSKAQEVQFQKFDNGMVSMQIPKGWVVGVGKSDLIHYTLMAYNPANPDYKIFFNMKTEGYCKTPQMRSFYAKYYPSAQMAKLPAINPQTTDAFYRAYTQSFNLSQSLLPFKVPVIKNFKPVQTLGKNTTGGSIVRAVYQDEKGKQMEGIFTVTLKEVAVPPVVLLNAYNTIFFTAPAGELIDWMPILNKCVGSINFSDTFINGYYREQGQVVANARAVQAICNQTSDIITSGWNERQKTYDILSQKRSDATMGYERVVDTDTGEIYKATNGFTDHDWHGKYEPITDDMYNLPTAGYIEKQ